jgi:septum site-determining protein MinC
LDLSVAPKAPAEERSAPFEIRGHLRTLLTLRLIAPRDLGFFPRLADAVAQAPNFFHNAPVVLDVAPVAGEPPVNLAEFARRLRQQRLVPVGIMNGGEDWNRMAVNAGLAILPAAPVGQAPAAPRAGPEQAPERPPAARVRMVVEPVRGGQQVYAPGGDLVVLAPVSHGAEVMADGNLHVYHRLRGRAFAGVQGDATARIFCRSLEAELVSIAGFYLVADEIDEALQKTSVQIRCADDRLIIEPLPLSSIPEARY